MLYLKSNKIIFRNLNTRNILLDDRLFPKICGFQFAIKYNDSTAYIIADVEGDPIFIAPEVLENRKYSEASDVYAFSMVAYYLLTEQIPFQNLSAKEISEKVKANQRPNIESNNIPESYKRLIQICWSQDPNERPSFEIIVSLLKTNEGFITEKIDKKEYLQYVSSIEEKIARDESIKQSLVKEDKAVEEEFIIDIDKESFEKADCAIQSNQIKIKIFNNKTCHEFIAIIQNKLNLNNVPINLTFNDQSKEIHVLNDYNPISNLKIHRFTVHCGIVVESTNTYIESLINAPTIYFGNDFAL